MICVLSCYYEMIRVLNSLLKSDMDTMNYKYSSRVFARRVLNSITCKCIALVVIALLARASVVSMFSGLDVVEFDDVDDKNVSNPGVVSRFGIRGDRFLVVPQIVWGLNNQKIAVARAFLTARMLNRTLLIPSLSASLFYKEIDQLQPISFDKVFQFEKFNSICDGFVRLGRFDDVRNRTNVVELRKGSGRKWTMERDFEQLREFSVDPHDGFEVIQIDGKNPFLWHDHWPVKDYAKVFECLVLVDEIAREADKVITKIRSKTASFSQNNSLPGQVPPYAAVHMRIEKDWMIHCKKREHKLNMNQICSSKDEITERVGNIGGLNPPLAVYLAVADSLLEDNTLLIGWKDGLMPFEKKKLGVDGIYKKHPYLIQSAIDYEVCLKADVFVGNSYSTFSSLIVLERTQKMIKMGGGNFCNGIVPWPSYAYNILGEMNGPQRWTTDMSGSSLHAISYGSNNVSCR